MSAFAPEWLALRERYDARARSCKVRGAVVAAVGDLDPLTVVDLGCGTGATLRALSPHLPARQTWILVDNDLSLLARAADSARPERVRIVARPVDLMRDLEASLDGAVDLVTTSALLDLVSADWIERLAVEIAARRLPFYAALSYDGRIACDPVDPTDAAVAAALNAHQRGDKGFGAALGPTAAAAAIARFKAIGYSVVHETADWVLGPNDRAIQNEVLTGWASAATDVGDRPAAELKAWLRRRLDLVAAGRSSIRVGHVDFFACPIATRRADRSQSNSTSPSSG
jgi:SAM-dependent methyltransferase